MNIGCFVTLFPSKNFELGINPYYGSSRSAYMMAKNLALQGLNIIVYTTSSSSKTSEEVYSGFIVHRYATNIKVLSTNISLGMFLKPLKYNVDIVNINFDIPPGPLAGFLYSKYKQVPCVVNYRGDWNENYGSFFRKASIFFFNKFIVDALLKQANVIISPSKTYIKRSKFLHKYSDKIVVIPNGINIHEFDVDFSKNECRSSLQLSLEEKIILFVGVLGYHKGPDLLLKAMVKILEVIPSSKLIYVGDGEMRNELEILSKELQIEKDVKFVGYVGDSQQKVMFYKSADVFVLPTTGGHEVFGNVNLEAMACGIPIVASNIGGVPDIVIDGNNGLLFEPGNFNELSNAVIYLLKNENIREQMGKNGREMVTNYSWEVIAQRTKKIYEQLLANGK